MRRCPQVAGARASEIALECRVWQAGPDGPVGVRPLDGVAAETAGDRVRRTPPRAGMDFLGPVDPLGREGRGIPLRPHDRRVGGERGGGGGDLEPVVCEGRLSGTHPVTVETRDPGARVRAHLELRHHRPGLVAVAVRALAARPDLLGSPAGYPRTGTVEQHGPGHQHTSDACDRHQVAEADSREHQPAFRGDSAGMPAVYLRPQDQGSATPGLPASERSRWVRVGPVARTAALPGCPLGWWSRASCLRIKGSYPGSIGGRMESAGGRFIGGRGGSMAGQWLPKSLAGWLAFAAAFCGLIWMEPGLWILPAAMLLGALMCVFRVRAQPMAEAAVAAVAGAVFIQLAGVVVGLLAVLLAATLSSLWESPMLRLLRSRGWLGETRMRELRAEGAGDSERAGALPDGDRTLRLREVPGKYRWLLLGMSVGVMLTFVTWFAALWLFRPAPRAAPSSTGGLSPAPVPSLVSVADVEWRFLGRDGREVTWSGLQGKVLFVNRWATWCAPCIAEMPGIKELTQTASLAEVVWLPISEEPLPVVLDFAREQGWDLPLYANASDTPAPFAGPGIPSTFIVDRQGRIVFRHVGAVEWNTPAAVHFLTDLLEE